MPSPFDGLIVGYGLPATLLAMDGVTQVGATRILMSNAKQLPLLGTSRGNVVEGFVAASGSVTPTAGLVVVTNATRPGAAPGPVTYYVIAKASDVTSGPAFGFAFPIALLLLPLPLVLTVKRRQDPPLPATLNAYDEAMTWDSAGRPVALPSSSAPVTTFTVRAGLSNDNNPLTNDAAGQIPAGIRTLYVPLGAGLRLGDTLVMPDGQESTVQQLNDLDAAGVPWAYQVLVDATAGGL